jgi:hypothetical protein
MLILATIILLWLALQILLVGPFSRYVRKGRPS